MAKLDLTQVQIFDLDDNVQIRFTPVDEEHHVCENVKIYCKMTTGDYVFQSILFGLAAKDFILACYDLLRRKTIFKNDYRHVEYRCSACNKIVDENDRYCSNCGEKLRGVK